MHARATVVLAGSDRVEPLVAFVRGSVLPVADAQSGSLGLSMSVDRTSGRCTVTTVWADRASMHASERALAALRESAARLAGAPVATEEYELAVLHRLRQAEPGCGVRTTRLRLDPAQVERGVRTFRDTTVPRVERLPGFRSVLLLVDRRSGGGVVSAVFDDRAALEASRAAAADVRSDESAQARAAVTDVVESEVAVAALRLPLHAASGQETSPVS